MCKKKIYLNRAFSFLSPPITSKRKQTLPFFVMAQMTVLVGVETQACHVTRTNSYPIILLAWKPLISVLINKARSSHVLSYKTVKKQIEATKLLLLWKTSGAYWYPS